MNELIENAKTDAAAFGELYRLHVDAVYKYFFFRVKDRSNAEDLCSQTWHRALEKIGGLRTDDPISFRAWLFKIAHNCLNTFFSTRRPLAAINEETEKAQDPLPSELSQEKEEAKQLRVLIDALPAKQRELILLRYSSDLRNKEIARILGSSEKTIASNLCRALETLRRNWEKLQ